MIWLGGGNTFYLRWVLQQSGFDKIISDLLDTGVVYAGGSAGAVVAGPTLKHFEDADDPGKAPQLIEEGLKLVNFVPVPHWKNEKFGDIITGIKQKLDDASIASLAMTDEQAIIVDGPTITVVP